jgi:acyl transferase domain-containing protein/NAD(P)-dependent dehydrogenase (short-subunit alcohol dehydrogenase family)
MLKAILALHHGILPPTIKVNQPNPALNVSDSPFFINTRPLPWIRGSKHPRRASVSSFGFGGSDFHVTLEQSTRSVDTPGPCRASAPTELVLVSAASAAELVERARSLAATGDDFPRAVRALWDRFDGAAVARLATAAADPGDLTRQLTAVDTMIRNGSTESQVAPSGLVVCIGPARLGRVAVLFSGQGSQYVGMGADIAMHLPTARAQWDRIADLDIGDRPLHRVVFPPNAFDDEARTAQSELLNATEWAQPALAAHSAALLAALRQAGVGIDCVAGHSFGELVALYAAGVFDVAALVRLGRRRGEFLRDIAPRNSAAMLAVAAAPDQLRQWLDQEQLWIANHNGPGQVVVSGAASAIDLLARRCTDEGVVNRKLRTSTAFHCPLVAGATQPFRDYLGGVDMRPPAIDVYGNANADQYPDDPHAIRERLVDHLVSPVRFSDQIEAMYAAGVRAFVEVGAGAALTGLVHDILDGRPHTAVSLDHKGRHGVTSLQAALAVLAVDGVPIRPGALWDSGPAVELPADRADRRMTVPISGANYGRPYPPVDGAAALPPPNPEALPGAAQAPSLPVPPASASPTSAWLTALYETQRVVADAHAEYQRNMQEGHEAFLQLTDKALGVLSASLGNASDPTAPVPTAQVAGPTVPRPVATTRSAAEATAAMPERPTPSTPVSPPPSEVSAEAVGAALLAIVAEQTGFPEEVIGWQMDLEGELGIDSIKRVQILAALRKRLPAMPDVPAADLSRLRRLSDVIERIAVNGNESNGFGGSNGFGASNGDGKPRDRDPAPQLSPGPAERIPADPMEWQQMVPPPAELPDAPARLIRTVTVAVPAKAPGLELPGLRDGTVLVVGDEEGIAAPLAAALVARGIRAVVVTADVPAPLPDNTTGMIVLSGLRTLRDESAAVQVNADVLCAARALAPAAATGPAVFVTVQDTGGDFGLSGRQGIRGWSGGAAALARTVGQEWPAAAVKAVDCECGQRDSTAIAAVLAEELLTGGSAPEVGLRANGDRIIIAEQEIGVTSDPVVTSDSVIIVTGGARGVTAAGVRALARVRNPAVVLVGRTPLVDEPPHLADTVDAVALRAAIVAHERESGTTAPDLARIAADALLVLAQREIRATLRALEALSCRVRYAVADVRDSAAMATVAAAARAEFGPITGVIHGAGVLSDGLLADKTDEQFTEVFDTKVAGLRSLLTATEADPLRLACVFSSVAARFGNAGQSDYAMANAVLDQMASVVSHQRPGCRVKSIAWGPWDGGMVGPELSDHFRSRGVGLMPIEAGADALIAELDDGGSQVRVCWRADDDAMIAPPAGTGGEILVSNALYPYLTDHIIVDQPVLPLVLALEWFAASARAVWPEGGLLIRDLTVYRKIPLTGFRDGGDRLLVTSCRTAEHRLALELRRHGESMPGLRAVAIAGAPPAPMLNSTLELTGSGSAIEDVYDGRVMFHGPAFRAVLKAEQLDGDRIIGSVSGVAQSQWPDRDWLIDPLAVDAGLQLAMVWAHRVVGIATVPMRIGEFRLHRSGTIRDTAHCAVQARKTTQAEIGCDIALIDPDGSMRAEMLDVVLVARPDLDEKR